MSYFKFQNKTLKTMIMSKIYKFNKNEMDKNTKKKIINKLNFGLSLDEMNC